jgi:hypothetical protein
MIAASRPFLAHRTHRADVQYHGNRGHQLGVEVVLLRFLDRVEEYASTV